MLGGYTNYRTKDSKPIESPFLDWRTTKVDSRGDAVGFMNRRSHLISSKGGNCFIQRLPLEPPNW